MLLAAGQSACHLVTAFFQAGELGVDPLQIRIHTLSTLGESAHFQIFLNSHLQKDPAAFRHQGQTLGDDLVAGDPAQILTQEGDGAGFAVQQAGNGVQRGGFAGTVGADQGNDLSLVDFKGDALDGVDAAVIDVNILNF